MTFNDETAGEAQRAGLRQAVNYLQSGVKPHFSLTAEAAEVAEKVIVIFH